MDKGKTNYHYTDVERSPIEIPSTLGMSARNKETGPSHSCHSWCSPFCKGPVWNHCPCHATLRLNYNTQPSCSFESVTLNWRGGFSSLLYLPLPYNFYLTAIWEPAEGEQEQSTVAFSPSFIPQTPNSEFVGKTTTEISLFKQSLYLEDQLCKFILILSAKLLKLILDSVRFKKYNQLLEHCRGSSLHLVFAPFIFKSLGAINEVRPSWNTILHNTRVLNSRGCKIKQIPDPHAQSVFSKLMQSRTLIDFIWGSWSTSKML